MFQHVFWPKGPDTQKKRGLKHLYFRCSLRDRAEPTPAKIYISMLKHAIVMEETIVDSTDDLSRLLFVSREQNGRDKIDGQSRPREPRTWALGKVDRDEQERSLSDTRTKNSRSPHHQRRTTSQKTTATRPTLGETSAALRDSAACYREVSENCHWRCE